MGVTPEGGVQLRRPDASPPSERGLAIRDAATAAWLMLLPCAALTVLAVRALGPWLGHRLFPAQPTFNFWDNEILSPNPREIGRYVLALAGPIILSIATLLVVRTQRHLPRPLVTGVVVVTQMLLLVTLGVCLAGQRQPSFDRDYFTPATLLVAALIAVVILAASRSTSLRRQLGARSREAWPRRLTAIVVAVALTAVWMLHALNTDKSIAWSVDVTRFHLAFHLDETFALLNGLTPLVSFTPQYGALWPYVVALPMLAFGKSLFVYTAAMSALTGVALLGIFGVLRRVTRNSLTALLLFVPFLATTLFHVRETLDNRFTFGSYFAMFPLRYAGPYLLAWLTARHLSSPHRRRPWPLFVAGGLVMMNNTDFGVAAVGATLAALLWTTPHARRRDELLSLAANAAVGIATAVVLVSLVTFIRSGSLPHFERLTEFARIFGVNGFSSIPMASVRGLPTVIYLTYAAAIVTATVRAIDQTRDRVLTGMLAWVGVFGLGSAVYYVTRAHPDVLPSTFSPWTLAIALLSVVTLRAITERPGRRLAALAFVVLFGLGIAICSVAQFPSPSVQLQRLHKSPGIETWEAEPLAPPSDPESRRFISSIADGPRHFVVKRGAPVVILATTGHRMADAYGVRDVTPYTGFDSILTVEQLEHTLDALRSAGGNTVVVPRIDNPEFNRIMIRRGFKIVTTRGLREWPSKDGSADELLLQHMGMKEIGLPATGRLLKWVDARHLHPHALD